MIDACAGRLPAGDVRGGHGFDVDGAAFGLPSQGKTAQAAHCDVERCRSEQRCAEARHAVTRQLWQRLWIPRRALPPGEAS